MNKDRIVVVGGYGAVGRGVCEELGRQFPGKVYAAGRNLERAERFCRGTEGRVLPMRLDIGRPVDPEALAGVRLVVMCLDQRGIVFMRACLLSGIHYIDVSANLSFLARAEALRELAERGGSTAVMNAGLAPGVTNLLALEAHRRLDRTEEIEITILLGLGDRHGKAAVEWTVDNLRARFEITRHGRTELAGSFTDARVADFRGAIGRKRAYRFPFSDQRSLPVTLGVPSVSTRLCFDPAAATTLLAAARKLGLGSLLGLKPVRSAAIACFGRMRLGSDRFVVQVEAIGEKDGKAAVAEYRLQGRRQSELTARCALDVAEAVYRTALPGGVFSIEQLLDWQGMSRLKEEPLETEIRSLGDMDRGKGAAAITERGKRR
ncbi:saccharopine dehydrogenase family protein [Cohnella cellulosilytica]|uniref:Saccharopine dehydrogenase family protein n=1 Tax=Cohnella cellulosilytica TaxID=986710 RepID=A0ABW2FCG4_9BACL